MRNTHCEDFKILLNANEIILAERNGVYAVSEEMHMWELDNGEVKFFNNYEDAKNCWNQEAIKQCLGDSELSPDTDVMGMLLEITKLVRLEN